MNTKAFAPEYQGALGSALSVNSSYEDVLSAALAEQARAASPLEYARAALAVAEANRRLGRTDDAERAWRSGYRAAREAGDAGTMAWTLWSGGTLARQRGALRLARRLLSAAAELGAAGGDRIARGYALAGLAETGRIQGDYAAVTELHEQLLAEAREHGETRHIVWALEGLAQIRRNTGRLDAALAMFREAAQIAEEGGDRRGHAWALRGTADVLSALGDTGPALEKLSRGEAICREMDLASALAYNRKMRGNVLYRAGRYEEARAVYTEARDRFAAIGEPRGAALSRLGLVKCRARLGGSRAETAAELDVLHAEFDRIGLHYARDGVEKFRAEEGLATTSPYAARVPDQRPAAGAAAPAGSPLTARTEGGLSAVTGSQQ